ncbi:MAG: PASTA domain-containing protein [Adlercreutzia sp.]
MAELWSGKTIPEVVGLSQPEAVDALAAKGFAAQAVEMKSDDPQGTVLSSDPEQGHRAEEGSTVTLSVAVPRIVPAIVGATATMPPRPSRPRASRRSPTPREVERGQAPCWP